jgi:probable rRNA maturation factor
MKFSLINKKNKLETNRLEKVAQAASSILGHKKDEIELIFISADKIKELNRNYRHRDEVTDVLSFQIEEDPLIGQVFLCYTRAKEQAEKRKINLNEEIIRLLVHGIAHLYGFDHHDSKSSQTMLERENLILKKVKRL